ncbi:MAG: DsrE family protein [Xanthomonadaceae bacterium]|nr:DsrE family protein [Xanthomonadaceae bacterium]MDE1962667.1 DsrE family protein [Xanthomonadaceae bacterium]
MNTRLALVALALGAAIPASGAFAAAATPAARAAPAVTWVYPRVPGFGSVHPRPDVDMQLDRKADYKVFVDVVSADPGSNQPYHSLQRLARLVNLMGYGKVPPSHVHIVALLDREAGLAALGDDAYRRYDKKASANPNLPLLRALRKAGVKLMVCSQAMAGMGLKDGDIDPSVTITLSGLTDPVIYGRRGYTFMQL